MDFMTTTAKRPILSLMTPLRQSVFNHRRLENRSFSVLDMSRRRIQEMLRLPRLVFALPAILLLCGIIPVSAQTAQELVERDPMSDLQNAGFPLADNYTTRKMGGYQVWRIAQDSRGIIYAANNQRLLEFDGANWRAIAMPESRWVFAVGVDSDDVVYVGAAGMLAFLAPDST